VLANLPEVHEISLCCLSKVNVWDYSDIRKQSRHFTCEADRGFDIIADAASLEYEESRNMHRQEVITFTYLHMKHIFTSTWLCAFL